MSRLMIGIFSAVAILFASLADTGPAAAKGGGDSGSQIEDRGRGRGQDDIIEGQQRREGRRGQHHLQEGQDHRRKHGQERSLQDDSTGRDGKRGRGRDDR